MADQLFTEAETRLGQDTFDLVEFAKCVARQKGGKRSTSLQFKTVYADDAPPAGGLLKVPVKGLAIGLQTSEHSPALNSGLFRKEEDTVNSFAALDPNNSHYFRPQQRNSGETSRIERFEDSRMEGYILPEMFKDDDY